MTQEKIDSFYREIGARIKKFREDRKMKPEILAQHINLTRQSVINIEKGRHKPSIHLLIEISVLFNIRYSKLIPEVSTKEIKQNLNDIGKVITDNDSLNKGTEQALKKFIKSINQTAKTRKP